MLIKSEIFKKTVSGRSFLIFITMLFLSTNADASENSRKLEPIKNIVVIYAENRSFDNLYGMFPGANGILRDENGRPRNLDELKQLDRDGITYLDKLPPVWNSIGTSTEKELSFIKDLPNKPFRIDGPPGSIPGLDASKKTPDLVHRFYNNQMQINDGKNDMFAAWSDAGGLAMGYYNGENLKMWKMAQKYTLADNFFMGAFGGSFINHFWLICACTPKYPNPPKSMISEPAENQKSLAISSKSPSSAISGPPIFIADKSLSPDGYAINTVQPPFQPSGIAPEAGADRLLADKSKHPLPPQDEMNIGDALSAKSVPWSWYAGSFVNAINNRDVIYNAKLSNFQAHHQPFNYFSGFDPTTLSGQKNRKEHLKDFTDFERDIELGSLPAVSFYKPQGNLNQHPGYTDVLSGDDHIAAIIEKLEKSPQWKQMVVIVTYDENGGFWDHANPPKIDRWGPGSRVPAIIVSPFAKKGYVDHTLYDTTSILKLITDRFELEPLPGVRKEVGNLENSLRF